MHKSVAPVFLLATPTLTDPNFHRTVVLVFHHDEKGALGVVVNRPTERRLKEVLKAARLAAADRSVGDIPVCYGGPVVTESGWVVFEGADPLSQSFEVADGLRVTGSLEVFRTLLKEAHPGRMLFTMGYAGWGAGQLDGELEAGAWIPVPVDRATLFDAPFDERWRLAYGSIGVDPNLWSMQAGES
jgi:putative transcriptional regulator